VSQATTRISLPDPDHLTPAQRDVYDAVASGPRGVVRGPVLLWLHSPEYASRAQKVGEFLRWDTVLEGRLSELVILVTARHYGCHYVWFNHSKVALEQGLAATVIEDIKHGRRPRFEHEDEAAAYAFATEMLETHDVSDETLERAKAQFGERGVVELGAVIGHYHSGAIVLTAARMPLPDGSRTCLPDLD
jgi:4-carboxymuconolactone decarboxylase